MTNEFPVLLYIWEQGKKGNLMSTALFYLAKRNLSKKNPIQFTVAFRLA